MPHPFASLSPAEQQEQLRPAAVFPISGAVWNAAQATVEITARHHEAKINVMGVPVPRSPTLASVAVTWCALASPSKPPRLQPYDLSVLEERLSGYSWRTYQTCMEELMEYASREAAPRRSDLVQAAARHMEAWGSDQIRGLAFEDLLLLLGNVTTVQPVTLRVPLLHWLASWTASRHGLKLAWETPTFTTSSAGVKLPSPCPLTQREWQNELREREKDGSLAMPDALTRFQSMERGHTQPQGPGQSDTPQWLSILQGPAPADPENMLRELDALGCVPGPQVGQVAAAVAALARPYGTSARVLQNLGLASVPAALVTAVKAVWSSCPASTQARKTADLQRLLDHVQQRHGSAVDGARVRRTLETVDKTITDAASLGYTRWSQAGLAVASTDDLPISAFQHIGNVSDEQEFRKGMLALVRGLDRIAQHDVLLEATKRALAVSEGDSFQWFLGKGAKTGASPPAAAQAPDPPSTRPTDATPQQAAPRPWTDQPPPASEAGPGRAPPTRVVRISGLRDLRAPEVSVGLSALFQKPVYLTPPDQQRGYGFAVIPAAVFENLFTDYPSRWYEFDGMLGVTLDSRRQSNGEAFHADLTALTVPPHLRPGPSPEQDPKRRRIDEGHRPPTSWDRAAPGLPGPPPPLAPERAPPHAPHVALHTRPDANGAPSMQMAQGQPWPTRRRK